MDVSAYSHWLGRGTALELRGNDASLDGTAGPLDLDRGRGPPGGNWPRALRIRLLFGLPPGSPPGTVLGMILAVITALSLLQAGGRG